MTQQTSALNGEKTSILIIGGGFSGASLAYHLANHLDAHINPAIMVITIIEPRATLGAGLAYSTDEAAFRLNVLSDRMSIDYDDKPHFARWIASENALTADPQAQTESGQVFTQRQLFARYMAAQMQALLDQGIIRHIRASAQSACRQSQGGYKVGLDNGMQLHCDELVIATSHPLPAVPEPLAQISDQPGFYKNPYQPNMIQQIDRQADILIVGAGLTSADMIAGLTEHGHRGRITVLSRHGLRSRPHVTPVAGKTPPPRTFGDFINPPITSATNLLRRIRTAITQAAMQDIPWQSVIDAVRDQGQQIWAGLSQQERGRIIRHLRSYWDVHRFRLATQTNAALDSRMQTNDPAAKLMFLAAHLVSAKITTAKDRPHNQRYKIAYRLRGQAEISHGCYDAIIITTGPAHGDIIRQCPPLAMLHEDGIIALDPLGLGIHTALSMQALDQSGQIVPDLWIAGPLARGTFGELMGAPEVARYTKTLAIRLAKRG